MSPTAHLNDNLLNALYDTKMEEWEIYNSLQTHAAKAPCYQVNKKGQVHFSTPSLLLFKSQASKWLHMWSRDQENISKCINLR